MTNTTVPPTPTNTTVPESTATHTPAPATPTHTPKPAATATLTPTVPVSGTQSVSATLKGDQLRVVGTGWQPNERLTISLSANADGSAATPLNQVRANRSGRFTFTIVVQPPPAGPIYAVVTNESGVIVIVPVKVTK